MEFKEFEYNPTKVIDPSSKERTDFNENTEDHNVIYFFYKDNECLYIGESKICLNDRCFKNTPKHADRDFFKKGNKIKIIILDENLDDYARQALEAVFILAYKQAGHPLENKEA